MAMTRAEGNRLIKEVFNAMKTARVNYDHEEFNDIPGLCELRNKVFELEKLTAAPEYKTMLKEIGISEYAEYFNKVAELAETFRLRHAKRMTGAQFLKIEDLSKEFNSATKYEARLDMINTFSTEDYKDWEAGYEQKKSMLSELLDKWGMGDEGRASVQKFLMAFSQGDKERFVAECVASPEILGRLLRKINMGDERTNLLRIFLDFGTGSGADKNEYEIPQGKVFNASFVDNKMYLNIMKPVPYEENIYDIDYQVQLPTPFTKVSFYYGGDNRISVPAISLIGINFDDLLYDDFYKGDIDFASLSPAEKESLFEEFVNHYLGKAFRDEFMANPLGLAVKIAMTAAVSILLSHAAEAVVLAVAIAGSTVGAITSGVNVKAGLDMLAPAGEKKQSAKSIKEYKEAAKLTAEAMVKVGVNAVWLIVSLIQLGEAVYKGVKLSYKNKQLKVGENVPNQNGNINSQKFSSWEEMKNYYKGKQGGVSGFVVKNKPKYSPVPRKWFAKGGTIEIKEVNGDKIWTYINRNGDSVPYINGYVKFSEKYLYLGIKEFNIGGFSGNRSIDNTKLIEILDKVYNISGGIPKGYIPHHDVHNGVYQLVQQSIHEEFTHVGGHSLFGGK